MCGIVGFVSKTKMNNLINSLTQEMSHRGPDAINTSISKIGDSYLHLGSARLSITGLEDGDMPMKDDEGNVLVYNGEIYELNKLRKKYLPDWEYKDNSLQKRYKFEDYFQADAHVKAYRKLEEE